MLILPQNYAYLTETSGTPYQCNVHLLSQAVKPSVIKQWS